MGCSRKEAVLPSSKADFQHGHVDTVGALMLPKGPGLE